MVTRLVWRILGRVSRILQVFRYGKVFGMEDGRFISFRKEKGIEVGCNDKHIPWLSSGRIADFQHTHIPQVTVTPSPEPLFIAIGSQVISFFQQTLHNIKQLCPKVWEDRLLFCILYSTLRSQMTLSTTRGWNVEFQNFSAWCVHFLPLITVHSSWHWLVRTNPSVYHLSMCFSMRDKSHRKSDLQYKGLNMTNVLKY